MQYRSPNIYQEVSNITHFGSVSESLGRPAAVSECMASNEKQSQRQTNHRLGVLFSLEFLQRLETEAFLYQLTF